MKMLENSIGSTMFNSVFVRYKDSGMTKDILNNGEFSCAFFVSSILAIQNLIDRPHTTVATVRSKLIEAGWKKVTVPAEAGDVIVWDKQIQTGTENEHIGIASSESEAISTSFRERKVARHHITFGNDPSGKSMRKITGIFRWGTSM